MEDIIYTLLKKKRCEYTSTDLMTLTVFLIESLKRSLPYNHVINQRSLKTLLKYHLKDLTEMASKMRIISDSNERSTNCIHFILQGSASVWKLTSQKEIVPNVNPSFAIIVEESDI